MTKLCLVPAFGLLLCLLGCIGNSAETMPTQMPTTPVQQTPSPNGEGAVALATTRSTLPALAVASIPPATATATVTPKSTSPAVSKTPLPTIVYPSGYVSGHDYPKYKSIASVVGETITSNGLTIEIVSERELIVQDELDVKQLIDINLLHLGEDYRGYGNGKLTHALLHDFEQDGTAELVLEIFTRGTSCCDEYLFFQWDFGEESFVLVEHFGRNWNQGVSYVDLNQDGTLQLFTTQGTNHASAMGFFGTAQILSFVDGQIVDLTDEYPAIVEADFIFWKAFLEQNAFMCDKWPWITYFWSVNRLGYDKERAWEWYLDRCEDELNESAQELMYETLEKPVSYYKRDQTKRSQMPQAVTSKWQSRREGDATIVLEYAENVPYQLNVCTLLETFEPNQACRFQEADTVKIFLSDLDEKADDVLIHMANARFQDAAVLSILYDATSDQFIPTQLIARQGVIHVLDLDENGQLEILARDEAFASMLGGDDSTIGPIQVYSVQNGELMLRSSEFNGLIREDSTMLFNIALHQDESKCYPQEWGSSIAQKYVSGLEKHAWNSFEWFCDEHSHYQQSVELIIEALTSRHYSK